MTNQPEPLSEREQEEILGVLRNQDVILGYPLVERIAATFAQLVAIWRAGEELLEYGEHRPGCRVFRHIGRPTGERAICDCGRKAAIDSWRKAAGEKP